MRSEGIASNEADSIRFSPYAACNSSRSVLIEGMQWREPLDGGYTVAKKKAAKKAVKKVAKKAAKKK
jgi:hypothetical protein